MLAMPLYVFTAISIIKLSCVAIPALGDSCLPLSAVQNDMCMDNHTYRHVYTSTLYECAAECTTSSVCESFSFELRARTCHLNSNNSVQADLSARSGILFSDIKHWNQTMTEACATVSCKVSSQCRTFRTDQTRCAPEFQGCGPPPHVSDASVTCAGHFLGAEADYSADRTGFCGAKTGSECQADGTWTVINDKCERFRWDNLVIPFHKSLPCQEHRNHAIKLKAMPLKKISLMLGRTVFNAWLQGSWRQEIIQENIPFAVNKTFLLDITARHGKYQIMVDGKPYASYPAILPSEAETIEIRDDVRVEWMEVMSELKPEENSKSLKAILALG